ncbi:hypothetical protein HMPREF1624_03774 [Sporothrix schenckii ATCC 58251]|uniref:Ketoreductase (KR) domain-containing protein n=1 Tax=Sporothrix schenckii (strain ATCC 58251 / de Perez 2211183) TaxID=1391915 RepID=U7PXV5_SPOS1|nr:hypothetical protein HMPREF1624_03774 [Sporothrix schenckii ATCC 58251]
MSAFLEHEAATQAGPLFNIRRQLFQSVPPIPSDVSLVGKTALVTGANVGLGLACARHFLALGASRLVMAVRTVSKGEVEAAKLRRAFPDAQIDVWPLDLAKPASSVRAFAARCARELGGPESPGRRLHVAVLNAGLGKHSFVRTPEGHKRETTLQVNYLSTALLGLLLLPLLKPATTTATGTTDAAAGRLTIITSDAALGATWPASVSAGAVRTGRGILDALDDPAHFEAFPQYCRTKMLAVAFAAKLAADVVSPDDVVVNTCNPGATKGTAFLSGVDSWAVKAVFRTLFAVLGRQPADAARAYVHASLVLGKESHGSFTDWKVRSWPVALYGAAGRAMMDKLWDETLAELGFASEADVLQAVHKQA